MLVNVEKAKKEFLKYAENYNLTEFSIQRKKLHSIRVMELSNKIAKNLNLNEEEIEIATLIGLLHDIARFEQFTKYKTFSDIKSVDHGDWGVEILNKDNFIRKFISSNKYDKTINLAIKNHNKLQIQEGLTEKEMLFCRIIRDADKLDIFYQLACLYWKKGVVEDGKLTNEDMQPFLERKLVDRKKYLNRSRTISHVLGTIALPFDINFKISFEILKKGDYLNKYIDRYEFKDKESKEIIEKIRTILNNYVEEQLKLEKG